MPCSVSRSRSHSRARTRSYSRSPAAQSRRRAATSGHRYSRSRSTSSNYSKERRRRYTRSSSRSSSSRSQSPIDSKKRSRNKKRSRTPRNSDETQRRNSRDQPVPGNCLGVFGLHVSTTQQTIREIFEKYGKIDKVQLIIDPMTRQSRGFCFIYYREVNDAKTAKDACSGLEVDGRRIRVDFSITKHPHSPTPGTYLGHPTRSFLKRLENIHRDSRRDSSYDRHVCRSHRERGRYHKSSDCCCRHRRRNKRSYTRSRSPHGCYHK